MAASRKPKGPQPPFTAREWEVLTYALDTHTSALDAHDEEWAEDLAEARALEIKVLGYAREANRKKST